MSSSLQFISNKLSSSLPTELGHASQMAAHQNAVITSINYRVGPFGFAALSEDHRAGVTTGNHALTDHQAALRFVRRHIRAFGGDPRRLTLFGQSSAGGLTLLHAVAPSSAGLLQGLLAPRSFFVTGSGGGSGLEALDPLGMLCDFAVGAWEGGQASKQAGRPVGR